MYFLKIVPDADPEEPFVILTEVRDSAIGKVCKNHWKICDSKQNIF